MEQCPNHVWSIQTLFHILVLIIQNHFHIKDLLHNVNFHTEQKYRFVHFMPNVRHLNLLHYSLGVQYGTRHILYTCTLVNELCVAHFRERNIWSLILIVILLFYFSLLILFDVNYTSITREFYCQNSTGLLSCPEHLPLFFVPAWRIPRNVLVK